MRKRFAHKQAEKHWLDVRPCLPTVGFFIREEPYATQNIHTRHGSFGRQPGLLRPGMGRQARRHQKSWRVARGRIRRQPTVWLHRRHHQEAGRARHRPGHRICQEPGRQAGAGAHQPGQPHSAAHIGQGRRGVCQLHHHRRTRQGGGLHHAVLPGGPAVPGKEGCLDGCGPAEGPAHRHRKGHHDGVQPAQQLSANQGGAVRRFAVCTGRAAQWQRAGHHQRRRETHRAVGHAAR